MAVALSDGVATLHELQPFLQPHAAVELIEGIPTARFTLTTEGMRANAFYFDQPQWVKEWFENVHRSPKLRERWIAAAGSWDGKVVVDVGCGPGNAFHNVGGRPATLIAVDIARGSLVWARDQLHYLPLLADAQSMPLRSEIADLVVLNATVHHCDNMRQTLIEAARLVKADGVLLADHDPQLSAYDFRGLGRLLWQGRKPLYRLLGRGGHRAADDEQQWAEATEIHHKPGDGVTVELFTQVLEPLGFKVQTYLHSHDVGAEILRGERGRPPLKIQIAQRLSGINPNAPHAALSILCVARRVRFPQDA